MAGRCLLALLLLPVAFSFHVSLAPIFPALRTASCHALHHRRHPGLSSIVFSNTRNATVVGNCMGSFALTRPSDVRPGTLSFQTKSHFGASSADTSDSGLLPAPVHNRYLPGKPPIPELDSLFSIEFWGKTRSEPPPHILNSQCPRPTPQNRIPKTLQGLGFIRTEPRIPDSSSLIP
jgi:hypothetical protein